MTGNLEVLNGRLDEATAVLSSNARRLTSDPTEQEDLMQDSFVLVIQKIDTVQDMTRVMAWIRSIETNLFLDRRRQRKRKSETPLSTDPTVKPGTGPFGTLLRGELSALVRHRIESAPENVRLFAVAACDLGFYETDLIAEHLGWTKQKVYTYRLKFITWAIERFTSGESSTFELHVGLYEGGNTHDDPVTQDSEHDDEERGLSYYLVLSHQNPPEPLDSGDAPIIVDMG